jgi:16S rRNA (guanine966-N2)-methyltransferase
MPDRIREAIFAILASHFGLPGTLPRVKVADLFAGSGSMGWEAVSRGAAGCDFIERDPQALGVLRENARSLDAGPSCRIHRGDAWVMPLATPRPAEPYGLIFVDPPYADSGDASVRGRVGRLLSDLFRARWVKNETMVVLHHPVRVNYESGVGSGWEVVSRRSYGTSGITFLMRRTSDAEGGDEAAVGESSRRPGAGPGASIG